MNKKEFELRFIKEKFNTELHENMEAIEKLKERDIYILKKLKEKVHESFQLSLEVDK